jgi:(2Fe-2S) ferredoxin
MEYELHLFICTNEKQKGDSCGPKGSIELRDELKKRLKEKYGKRLRVNASGCLGPCEKGINAVLYPQGKWFHFLTLKDVDMLEEYMIQEMEKR